MPGIFSIGHSTRPIGELVALLRRFEIVTLADIRTIPRSRWNPQFNASALASSLAAVGIAYVHLPRLGGLRHSPRDESPNKAWRNESFRAYADHMLTPDFEAGLAELQALAGPVALMCAESVPWRCHRSLVSDVLFARGVTVEHIVGPSRAQPHRLTAFGHVVGTQVIYPLTPLALPLLTGLSARARERRSRNRP